MENKNLDFSHYFWQGKNIRLRPLETKDVNQRFINSLDSETRQIFNLRMELPTTLDLQTKYIEDRKDCKEVKGMIVFVIENNNNEFAGLVTMHSIDEKNGIFSFGIAVNRDFRKKGYAFEAAGKILKYGFHERRFQKCNSACAHTNPASIALHKKLGFIKEGQIRSACFYNGQYHDEILFGMLHKEYENIEKL